MPILKTCGIFKAPVRSELQDDVRGRIDHFFQVRQLFAREPEVIGPCALGQVARHVVKAVPLIGLLDIHLHTSIGRHIGVHDLGTVVERLFNFASLN